MKGKLLNAYKDGHSTYVTKQTKYGTFHSKVTTTNEDQDVENELDGYHFAEAKCDLQALKYKWKYMEQRAKGVEHAYNVLTKSGLASDDKTLKKLKRQVLIAKREALVQKNIYKYNCESFKKNIESTIKYRKKLKNK